MPIYAYKCSQCGFAKDVLQKISDAPLTVCPSCGQAAFAKQVTAAGFQLKGSGWYVTDFRDGGKAKDKPANGSSPAAESPAPAASAAPSASPSSAPSPAPAAASSPAPASGNT
ncbi:MAG: zinc ribbon domain-containing protein [Pseudomonadota bacterium]|nr:zinc ribbon domain-containing protein [Pseudomonadota bacterium]